MDTVDSGQQHTAWAGDKRTTWTFARRWYRNWLRTQSSTQNKINFILSRNQEKHTMWPPQGEPNRKIGWACLKWEDQWQMHSRTLSFFYSKHWSEAFFPDFVPPNTNPLIIIALISSASHFVAIEFKEPSMFPAPRQVRTLGQKFSENNHKWELKYIMCMTLYKSLTPKKWI